MYLKNNYLYSIERIERWALCFHRFPHANSNTNMVAESFHSVLKSKFLNRVPKRRLDDLMDVLVRVARDYQRRNARPMPPVEGEPIMDECDDCDLEIQSSDVDDDGNSEIQFNYDDDDMEVQSNVDVGDLAFNFDDDSYLKIQSNTDEGDPKIQFVGGDLSIESNDVGNLEIQSNENNTKWVWFLCFV